LYATKQIGEVIGPYQILAKQLTYNRKLHKLYVLSNRKERIWTSISTL